MFVAISLVFLFSFPSAAKEVGRKPTSVSIKSFDGFPLRTEINIPKKLNKSQVKSVVIFVHGSGPHDLNEDLSEVTSPPGTSNLFFKDISDNFLRKGIATLRYNKRAYEAKLRLEMDAKYKTSSEFKSYLAHPLNYLVKDLAFFVDFAHKEFPNAKINILGHSEGTQVALIVASQKKFVHGTALIGFTNEPTTTSVFEQFVYRSQGHFKQLDKNSDEILDQAELSADSEVAQSLKKQLPILDLNRDGMISLSEYKAGNYSNLVLQKLPSDEYRADQALLPIPSDLIKSAKHKILFLQGEWDNQTPQCFTQAIQLVNQNTWKKTSLKFIYFPKAGHALDPRDSYEDIMYKKTPQETLEKMTSEVAKFFN